MPRLFASHPDLEQLKRQAKELRKAQHAQDPAVCSVLRRLQRFADASDADILHADISLHEAQYALALDYGFTSWHALKQHVLLVNRAATPTLRREGERAWIPRVPNYPVGAAWNRQLCGLRVLLGHRGISADVDELSVLSGEAFSLSHPDYWHETTTLAVPTDILTNAAAAFGLNVRWHITPFRQTMAEYEPLTLAALEDIRNYLDRGEPVLAGGVTAYGCDTWSVVVGYELGAPQLLHAGLGRTPRWLPIRGIAFPCHAEEGLDKHWNAQVQLPYHGAYTHWLVNPYVTLEREALGVDARQRTLAVLRRALELFALPVKPADHNDSVNYWFGQQAYEHLIADFTRLTLADILATSAREAACRLRMMGEQADRIIRGRAAAAAYCETAILALPSAQKALTAAAHAFRCVAALAQQHLGFLVTCTEAEKRQWFDNPRQRLQAAQNYRAIYTYELDAMENLATAIAEYA